MNGPCTGARRGPFSCPQKAETAVAVSGAAALLQKLVTSYAILPMICIIASWWIFSFAAARANAR